MTGLDTETGREHPAPLTISSLAHDCDAALTRLCQDLPGSPYHDLENDAADEAGRFKIWAANIGALQDYQSSSSLDSRLRAADRMKDSVVSGLSRLERTVTRATAIALGNQSNRTKSPLASTEELVNLSIKRVSEGVIEGESENNGTHSLSTTELAELFLNIRSRITHLFTLSMLIRRDRPRGRTLQHGPQKFQTDPGPDITNAKDKFPKLKQTPWLAERIGNKINQQREYIRYRQTHRKNLTQPRAAPAQDGRSEVLSGRVTTKATSFYESVGAAEDPAGTLMNDLTDRSITTTATSFATTAPGDKGSGRRIPQLTDMWLDGVHLEYNTHIECPYCRIIQIFRDRRQWKRHVYRDLQPYICTFDDCSVEPFPTSHEWFKHEMDNHRRQWKCNQCHAKYDSASALESHFISCHSGSVSAAQRPVMLKACEKALTNFDKTACPLCDDWNPLSTDGDNSNRFRSHLGKHLQELAPQALPLAIDGLDIRDTESDVDSASDEDDEASRSGYQEILVPVGFKVNDRNEWDCLGLGVGEGALCRMRFPLEELPAHFRELHPEYSLSSTPISYICRNCSEFNESTDSCLSCGDWRHGFVQLYSATISVPERVAGEMQQEMMAKLGAKLKAEPERMIHEQDAGVAAEAAAKPKLESTSQAEPEASAATHKADCPPSPAIPTSNKPSLESIQGASPAGSNNTTTGRPGLWTNSSERKVSRLYLYTTLPLAKIIEVVHAKSPETAPGKESTKKLNALLDKEPRWLRPRSESDMSRRLNELSLSPTRFLSSRSSSPRPHGASDLNPSADRETGISPTSLEEPHLHQFSPPTQPAPTPASAPFSASGSGYI